MYLNEKDKEITIKEIDENIKISGLSLKEMSEKLGCDETYLQKSIVFEGDRVEDIWIIRNFLINYITYINLEAKEFTVFNGDFRREKDIDKKYIGSGILSPVAIPEENTDLRE